MTVQLWRIVLGILIRKITSLFVALESTFTIIIANRQLVFCRPSATKIVTVLLTQPSLIVI